MILFQFRSGNSSNSVGFFSQSWLHFFLCRIQICLTFPLANFSHMQSDSWLTKWRQPLEKLSKSFYTFLFSRCIYDFIISPVIASVYSFTFGFSVTSSRYFSCFEHKTAGIISNKWASQAVYLADYFTTSAWRCL